jgi:hypothetical protein
MTQDNFRARLDALGIKLDERAFEAAFKGAQHLRSEIARIHIYLTQKI